MLPGAQPHVDDVVRHRDHVGVVLHHQDRVPLVAELTQNRDEPLVVARMQTNRRLVEHVERPDQRRAEGRSQVDPLSLAARQRGGQAVERQIVEPHVAQKSQTSTDLVQHLLGNGRVLRRQLETREERERLLGGQRRDAVDREVPDPHGPRLTAQTRARTIRTGLIPAIAAQEHADVHLVFLAVEPGEEPAHAVPVVAVAIDDEPSMLLRQVLPRHVKRHALGLGHLLQVGLIRPVMRLGPRLDRALAERLRGIGHDQVEVELDDVAEAVARRTRAERVVEREQPRLRHLVGQPHGRHSKRSLNTCRASGGPGLAQLERPRGAAAFLIRDLDGVGDARARRRTRP